VSWAAFAVVFASGLLGIGMFTSVPQTVVMLVTMGWFVTARRQSAVTARVPAARRRLDPAEGHS
jgi:proteasome assembly chaperone (PAC2) family protein